MRNDELQRRVAALSDVDLVRLLTMDDQGQDANFLEAARAEAERRGLPLDPSFVEGNVARDREVDGQQFEAAGKPVACPHCGNTTFDSRAVVLNTRGLTFFNLDWLNRGATALVCDACGRIELFAEEPVVRDEV